MRAAGGCGIFWIALAACGQAPTAPAGSAPRGGPEALSFEHGVAAVNTGDAEVRFAAPSGFVRLAGTQDPAHDDGMPVTAPLAIAAH